MDLNESNVITDFSFTAKLWSRGNPISVMAISASGGHVSVMVKTTNGLHPGNSHSAVSKEALIAASLPLNEIKPADLPHMQLLVPNGFPRTEAEEALAKKLESVCDK